MPKNKTKVTATEIKEQTKRLTRIKQMGIVIGSECQSLMEPDKLVIEAIEPYFARIYELPPHEVAIVLPVKILVAAEGVLITGWEIELPFDNPGLEMKGVEEISYYQELIKTVPYTPRILNSLLTQESPLSICQKEGILIAHACSCIFPAYHDEESLIIKLWLWDQRRNELCFDFAVTVDRSLKRIIERHQQIRRSRLPSAKRSGLYSDPIGGRLETVENPSPKQDGSIKHIFDTYK